MIETIFKHRSVRKYKNKPIEDKILNEILHAGTKASNTGNMQVYSMIVTKDENLRKELWAMHFKQDMVVQAPVIITFCADINRFNKWCKLRNAKPAYDNFLWFYNASIDALLASQNVALAAESHNLGICYLGTTTYMAEKITNLLKLPKGVVPVTTLVVGYPDESNELTDRLPLEAIVHNETYKDYSDDDINNFFAEKESLAETKELIKSNETENLAQIFTDKRYTQKDNVLFSKLFLQLIEKQGFMNNE